MLWLFAAAVPAATVLLNGSMVPLSVVRADEDWSRPASTPQEDTEADEQVAVIAAGPGESIWSAENVPGLRGAGQAAVVVAASSVLHTALQRHRPKAA